jgi:hypothetical protein
VSSLFWQCPVQYIPGLPKVRKPCMFALPNPGFAWWSRTASFLLRHALLLSCLILDLLIG